MRQLLCTLILLGMASLTSAQNGTWTQGASLSTPRAGLGAVAVDGRIYLIGGGEAYTKMRAPVDSYDPATDTWSTKADMPTPRGAMAVCELGGQIYTIGGMSGANKKDVEVYDPATDTWAERAGLSLARLAIAACPLNGKIYVFGGAPGVGTINGITVAEVYDPGTDAWDPLTDMPEPASGLTANAVDGMIYVMGWQNPAYVFRYDPSADTWTQLADVPGDRGRWGASSLVIGNKIYVIGGMQQAQAQTMVDMYDPATDSWTQLPDLGVRRMLLGTAFANGKIYAFGGSKHLDFIPVDAVEIYDTGLSTAIEALSWAGVKLLWR